MSDSKISLSNAERRDLRELARRKSEALAAEEVAVSREALEASLQERAEHVKDRLSSMMGRASNAEEDLGKNMDANWLAIQARMTQRASQTPETPAKTIQAPRRQGAWLFGSGILAAALVLLMVRQYQEQESQLTDSSLTKGGGESVYPVPCNVSLAPTQGEAKLQEDGQSFVIPAGVPTYLQGKCQTNVYMHVFHKSVGSQETALNIPVGPTPSRLSMDGKALNVASTQPGQGYVVLYVTSSPLAANVVIPEVPFVDHVGDEMVSWSDDITFVAK